MNDRNLKVKWETSDAVSVEMSPDVYGGENCDEVVPRWAITGRSGSPDHEDTIEMDAKHFPPGTMVEVSEPICPVCDHPARYKDTDGICLGCKKWNWNEWMQDRYS